MTRAEFRRRLDKLRGVITRGLWYYTAWKSLLLHDTSKLSWSLEEQNKVLGRFNGFFTPVGSALLGAALMQFAKVFDPDARAVSLWNLLGAARQDTSLLPGRTSAEVNGVSRRFRQSRKVLTGLMRRRDQHLAHADANPAPADPLLLKEFDGLVEEVESAFNWLSTAHDGRVVKWNESLREVEAHTSQVMGALVQELNREHVARRAAEELSRS